jgi:hypothetical protein
MMYMGTVVRALGCRFQINSDNHGNPHCHIVGHGSEMKVDLTDLEILGDTGFSERDVKRLIDIVRQYETELRAKWEEYHGKKEEN